MRVINYGSLNIDYVYRVPHISRPGETLSSSSYEVFTGGKGANQSVALARAGAQVAHAGKVGKDGEWLLSKLDSFGVDTRLITVGEGKTGHAIIQVDDEGENSIVLYPGANRQIRREEIDNALESATANETLLLQNEINNVPYLIQAGHKRGMKVCLNPAPFGDEVLTYPLHLVDTLIVNRIEGQGLAGGETTEKIIDRLSEKLPETEIILTLGSDGALCRLHDEEFYSPGVLADTVDTTAAGDTFIGYYLASRLDGRPIMECLQIACRAAAICVSRRGAQDSIPKKKEVSQQSIDKE